MKHMVRYFFTYGNINNYACMYRKQQIVHLGIFLDLQELCKASGKVKQAR